MARKRTSLDVLFTRKEADKPAAEEKKPTDQAPPPEISEDKQQISSKTAEEQPKEIEPAGAEIKEKVLDRVDVPQADPEVEILPEPEMKSESEKSEKIPAPPVEKKIKPVRKGGWEFRTLQIFYDQVEENEQVYWEYLIEFSDGSRLTGLSEILNSFAEKGWDLVNLFPSYTASLGTPGESFAMELRAILKRERN